MNKLIAIVCGSRDFNNFYFLKERLNEIFQGYDQVTIVSGGARGADKLGEKYSKAVLGRHPVVFHAQWDRYGKAAGPMRNYVMADYVKEKMKEGYEGICIAFRLTSLKVSAGTDDMIEKAVEAGITTKVIEVGYD